MTESISQRYPSISVAGRRLEERYKVVLEKISNTKSSNQDTADIQRIVPGTPFNAIDIGIRLALVAEACRTLVNGKSAKLTLYPKTALDRINSSCENILAKLRSISDIISNFGNDPVQSIDVDQLIYITSAGAHQNIGSILKEVDDLIDTALSNLSPLSFSARSRGFNPLELALSGLSETLSSVNEILSEAKKSLQQTKSAKTQSTNIESELQEISARVKAADSDVTSKQKLISEKFDAVQTMLADLESFEQRAIRADEYSQSFQEKFQKFDDEINTRNDINNRTLDELKKSKTELEAANLEAQRIIEEARTALNISVAYALATSFEESEGSIQKTIPFTGLMFVSSVIFLVFLVFVAVDPRILPGVSSEFIRAVLGGQATENGDFVSAITESLSFNDTMATLSNLGIRFLIVLPGIILVRVAARTFESQIVAKRQYKFKKTIATALPGFRDQVSSEGDDEFRRRVTLLAFGALSENPDERISMKSRNKSGDDDIASWIRSFVRRE